MKTIPVQEAIGTALAHDMTQILPGEFKGSRFKKGHIITAEDIPVLLSMGKHQVFVLELGPDMLHENDAAIRLAACAAGDHIDRSEPNEGKVDLRAGCAGLLKVNAGLLNALNDTEEIMFATLHTNQLVTPGQKVGGTRVIPLAVKTQVIEDAEKLCSTATLIDVVPLKPFKVGLVTTGSEIFSGRIRDQFGPVLERKFAELGSTVSHQILASDDEDRIVAAIHELIAEGVELVAVTGGMSVDPDDRTPASIRKAGAEIVTYGAPVLPGAMFLLAYIGEIPIIGLPGCVMYHDTSIFDLIVPRILAGEKPTRAEIKSLGHSGLCSDCKPCHYPNCGFGKG
jgi:molybdopterin biosynthesis enzyme